MSELMSSAYNYYTGSAFFQSQTSDCSTSVEHVNVGVETLGSINQPGKYSIFEIADWFLTKAPQTQKKLQKLCYYAQAWSLAKNGYKLIDSDFEAWIHGPVSPALYDRFKSFGYEAFKISGNYNCEIDSNDIKLLEDVWETYGSRTGNALEVLSHSELPWIKARRGYASNERCTVVIDPIDMASYYKSIMREG